MKAKEILSEAARLVSQDREKSHGDKKLNHKNIAALWNAWLSIRRDPSSPLTGEDVAQMMSLLKKARTQSGEKNPDDNIDDSAYSAIAGELAG